MTLLYHLVGLVLSHINFSTKNFLLGLTVLLLDLWFYFCLSTFSEDQLSVLWNHPYSWSGHFWSKVGFWISKVNFFRLADLGCEFTVKKKIRRDLFRFYQSGHKARDSADLISISQRCTFLNDPLQSSQFSITWASTSDEKFTLPISWIDGFPWR